MKRGILVVLAVAAVLILAAATILIACAKPAPAPAREKVTLVIKPGKMGQDSWIISHTLAELMEKKTTWLRADVVESLGSTAHMKEVASKPEMRKTLLFTGVDSSIPQVEKGIKPFDTPYSGARSIVTYYDGPSLLITYNPNIKSGADLVGKKIMLWLETMSGGYFMHGLVKETWGLGGKVEVSVGGLEDIGRALRDGVVDVGQAALSGFAPDRWDPNIAFAQLIAEKPKGLRFVSVSREDVEAVNQKRTMLMHHLAIPANVLFPGQEAFGASGNYVGLWADESMPEDVVYEITKIAYENIAVFKEKLPTSYLTKETIGRVGNAGLLHPGAAKFYKERKVPIGTQ